MSQPAVQTPARRLEQPATAWSRLQGIFFAPVQTFESIARNPTWLFPLVLMVAVSLLSIYLISQVADMAELMRTTIENSPRGAQMTEEQMEQGLRIFETPLGQLMFYAGPVVFPIGVVLAISGMLMLMICLTGGDSQFPQILGVTAHSLFAYYLLVSTLTVVIVGLSSDPSSLRLQSIVCSNPGFLLDSRDSPILYTLASGLDLLIFYAIFLIGLGVSKAAERVSLAGGMGMTLLLYGVWVVGKTAITALW